MKTVIVDALFLSNGQVVVVMLGSTEQDETYSLSLSLSLSLALSLLPHDKRTPQCSGEVIELLWLRFLLL